MTDTILTPNKFALIVENIVKEKKISYIDAILDYCTDNEIDPANARSMTVSYTHLTLPTNREV